MKDIHSLEQGNKSVEVYFHKLKGLWDEYTVLEPAVNCVCGAHKVQVERDQKRKLLQFLMGLHESNSTVRGQILMMSPLPSVSQAYAYVKQDEKARQGYNHTLHDTSFAANAFLGAFVNSPVVAAVGAGYKRNNIGSVKHLLKCTYCNFNGHVRENCNKLIGYPANWKKKKDVNSSSQTTIAAFRNLPKTNQANAAISGSLTPQGPDQFNQLQKQINQLSQMMSLFTGTGK